ncbi:MAG: MFS transporter [Clostridiales bacterium]|uniref:MDR family MFS transporter n=1 Tax=Clostridium sp. N3C TaxID=1776758 RepID=UPI00092DF0B9|nr:MFS transporter [Clostridium sp. N3C]NLZ47392.1 MFS transporter [Clostridiales bacterium]SCN25825.1 putative transporter [Clostridium sp. N3C]
MFSKLNIFKGYKGLPRSMYVLFVAQIINRFGDFVMPFLTLYLTVKIGLSAEVTGFLVMLTSIINMPASLIGGYAADKFGRKKTYLYAQSAAALTLLPCAFFSNAYINVGCLMISTFFSGFLRPAMDAMVSDILPPEKRQTGFALEYLGINIGVALGPLVSGILFNKSLPLLFIGDAFTSFIAVYLVASNIEETNTLKNKQKVYLETEREEKKNVFLALLERPQLLVFFFVYIIFSIIYTQHRFSLPLTMNQIFGDDGTQKFSLLMSTNAFTVIGLTVIITAFTSKLHPLANMVIAGITYAVGFGMVGHVDNMFLLILSTVIWTIGEILVTTSFGVYVANNSPSNYRATFNAVGSISWSIGSAAGTYLAGVYIKYYGLGSLWNVIIVLSIIGSLMMGILKKKKVTVGSKLK